MAKKIQRLLGLALALALLATPGHFRARGATLPTDVPDVAEPGPATGDRQGSGICREDYVVTAASGSFDDLEEAIGTVHAAGGGIVRVPEGEFTWGADEGYLQVPGGVSIIGAGPDKTILKMTARTSCVFDVNHHGHYGDPVRISGISFVGWIPDAGFDNSGTAIAIASVRNFRIDHCHFEGFSYIITVGAVAGYPNPVGVVDHCLLQKGDMPYKTVYGVVVRAHWEGEDRLTNLGTGEAVFIEDNTFIDLGHPTASFGGGHYVARYNLFQAIDNDASFPLDGHGPGFDSSGRGTRCMEIYHNVIEDLYPRTTLNWRAIGPRSGGGVIFNNTIRNFRHAVIFTLDTDTTEYPALDQIHDYYIWDNTLENVTEEPVWIYGTVSQQLIQEGRDYFLRAPSQELDGFTYTPYVYPHPLTQELGLTGTRTDGATRLDWSVCVSLPVSGTWRIDYDGTPGIPPSPATSIISPTRAYTLTALTNYEWYTITLSAVVDSTVLLSDTVCVMPTDIFVHLPLVMRED